MKKIIVVLMLCITVCLAGCTGGNENNTNTSQETETVELGTDNEEATKNDKKESDDVAEVQTSENDTAVYIGSDSVVDVVMGACVDGTQTDLCVVKMPDNYFTASLYMDESGQINTMHETDGRLLADVMEDGSLENCVNVPNTVVMTAQGNVDDSYTFTIVDSGTISVDSEKDYAPDGVDISTDGVHDAYVYSTSGQYDVVLVYEINEDWTLLIGNSGQLKDTMSLDAIGQEFYSLVTPIE